MKNILTISYFKHEIKEPLYSKMGKLQNLVFMVCNLLLSAYFSFAVVFVPVLKSSKFVMAAILFGVCTFVVYNLLIYLCFKLSNIKISAFENKQKVKLKTILVSSLICFIPLLIVFIDYFPGSSSPDTINQWKQVQNFTFNDWHPVIHTLIIWLVTRVVNHYAFFILFQITLFSIAVGYLIATLQAWGVRRIILFVLLLVISLNRDTMGIMMFAWKDSFLTVLITFLCSMMINIFLSKGEWLSKYKNVFIFSILVALVSLIRHNGFFFTLPLLFFVFVFYIRKNVKVIYACILPLFFIFLIKVPLYSTLKVTYHDNKYPESVGLPMTIMCDLYYKTPERVPTEVKLFLEDCFGVENFEEYLFSNYNSIKFNTKNNNAEEVIKEVSVVDFAKMTISTINVDPKTALLTFISVTDFVWGFPRAVYSYTTYTLSKVPIYYYFVNRLGVMMMLLLFVGLLSLAGSNGISSLILIIPSVVYNALTMLLLCGNDHRFFHFNVVITFALLIALLISKNNEVVRLRKDGLRNFFKFLKLKIIP